MTETEDDDAPFEALDRESDHAFGPEAVLLCGFDRTEAGSIELLLRGAAAGEHRVVCCTTTMGSWTIERALGGDDGGKLLPVGKIPRVMLLSGLSDAKVQAVLDAYAATGLERPIFAVATPANLGFTVIRLLEELMAERQAMAEEES